MKIITTAAILLAALTPVVNADFDIYWIWNRSLVGQQDNYAIKLLNAGADVSCDQSLNSESLELRGDVSGSKRGARCDGSGDTCRGNGDPSGIKVLEMNPSRDDVHFTIYKDRDYGMYDKSGGKVGSCQPLGHNFYSCNNEFLGQHGKRLLRCRSEWTASEIMG